jgi:anti-sigma B factor antagonist
MNSTTQILVAVGDSTVFLRVIGRADCLMSAGFRHAIEELQARGYRDYAIELSECPSMDSTFLGLLAVLATRPLAATNTAVPPARIALLQPSPSIVEALRELGIIDLFHLSDQPAADAEYRPAPAAPISRADLTRTSLEGHQALIDLHAPNAERFKDVIEFLKEDLGHPDDAPG